jgi:two-component system sensor kinase FixL
MDSGWAMLSVADSGPGINADIADRLFEPFATTKITGIGMGLAMSRAIVEAYDGKLWVEDGAAGGAVFRFTIPPADFKESPNGTE